MSFIERRRFNAILGALSFVPACSALSGGGGEAERDSLEPEILRLSRNGWMPNNEHLPVLLYRRVLDAGATDVATLFEWEFRRNGWPPQWRNGIYDFHHYHSTAHEVLGFAAGHARLMLGGENGQEVTVNAGDVAILPTGTGHCKLTASSDFLVVGAYPPDQNWDICRHPASESDIRRMKALPFPNVDPVGGTSGPLTRLWKRPDKG